MNLKDEVTTLVHAPQEGIEDNATFRSFRDSGILLTLVTACGKLAQNVDLVVDTVTCLECLSKTKR